MSAAAVGGIAAVLLVGTLLHLLVHRPLVALPALGILPSWRVIFLAASVPGILLVLATAVLLRDPPHAIGGKGARTLSMDGWPALNKTAVCCWP